MADRPFRFGIHAESVRTREELIGTARAAEAAGYATFLLRDHFVEEPFGHQLAPIAALATAAAATERLRIGTLVFANDYRHPALLAKEAATLDLLSGGRFELGLGTGFLEAEYAAAGLPFDSPGVRVARFAEALAVLKGLFAGEPYTFAGRHYTIAGLDSYPRPAQRPRPPILVGAGGRRMLALAAREADIIGLPSVSTAHGRLADDPTGRLAETVAGQIAWIREAAGPRFRDLELSTTCTLVVTADRERAAAQLAAVRGWRDITAAQVLAMPSIFIGTLDQIAEEMRARRARYGFSYYIVFDSDLDTAAPLVARLAGE